MSDQALPGTEYSEAEYESENLLPPVAHFLSAILDPVEPQGNPIDRTVTWVQSIGLDLPVEMQTEKIDDAIKLRMSPPTQRTLTSVYPVLHRLSVRLVADDSEGMTEVISEENENV